MRTQLRPTMSTTAISSSSLARFRNAKRIQESALARGEKRALIWMAERTPAFVNSDHLTILGFAAQIATGGCYALSRLNRIWLIASIGCLALNWFGDSLDGTLARVRQKQRPRYGFYVDHLLDATGTFFLMSGLALSGYMNAPVAYAFLILYLLL